MAEILAASLMKLFCRFVANFIDRFQTIHHKAGIEHCNGFYALLCQFHKGFVSVRLEPFFWAKARLECRAELLFIHAETCAQKP